MSAPTIKDVARLAQVSTATVSAVINETSYVSPELKKRVSMAITKLGYAPSGVARSLRTQATRLVGLIVADITNPFFTDLVRRIGSELQGRGYSVLLCESDHDVEKEMAALQLLAAHRADGVLLAPTGPVEAYFRPPVTSFSKPLTMVDRVIPNAPFDMVSLDNYRAAFDATRYMLSLGHERLAIVAGAPHLANTSDRMAGFRDALAAHSVDLRPDNVVYGDFRQDRARERCRELLSRPDRPTALFVSNNEMAIGAMRAIHDLGLSCPHDLSLASIDDFPWADAFSPRLTVVRQPMAEIAAQATSLLSERMAGGTPQDLRRIVLSGELIIRDSCAPPKT